jgi:hypothetical protein
MSSFTSMKKERKPLHFGKIRGQHRLSQDEERKLAESGEQAIGKELHRELDRTVAMTMMDAISFKGVRRARLNSLIWVYVQLVPDRIKKNMQILMGFSGVTTINKFARALEMNASFISKMLAMRGQNGFGGWNFHNLLVFASILKVDPRLILLTDLEKVIKEQSEAYKIPQIKC